MKGIGERTTLTLLIPSHANIVLPNGAVPSPDIMTSIVLQVPTTTVANGTSSTALIYTDGCGLGFLLATVEETLKYVEPLSDNEGDVECLFEDSDDNDEARSQFWLHQSNV